MSAPDQGLSAGSSTPVRFGSCPAEIVELAARRGRSADLAAVASSRGLSLPAFGEAVVGAQVVISVRPERWLLISSPGTPGFKVADWHKACAGTAAVIDLSSGLAIFYLAGDASAEVLVRGCRLDLYPAAFPAGHAAATTVAQVAVTIVKLPAAWLLLTPATTARHFAEWLALTGAPFRISQPGPVSLAAFSGEQS